MFARANLTIGNNIFVNASLRREGSSKLGENEQWGCVSRDWNWY